MALVPAPDNSEGRLADDASNAGGHAPLLLVRNVSRSYPRVEPPGRLKRFSMRIGGVIPDAPVPDDEEADLFDELDEEPPDHVGGTHALRDVSFSAFSGSCVGIVGGERAGKSVLLKIIAGAAPPTSGSVVRRGTVGPALDWASGLFPKMPFERGLPVVAAMLRVNPRKISIPETFELVGDPELRHAYPGNVNGKRRQHVVLAMMLTYMPELLLVDCNFPRDETAVAFRRRIEKIRMLGGVVILTGREIEDVAWLADTVVHLERGRVVGEQQV